MTRATDLTWHFDKVPLDSSAILRVNFITSDNVSHNSTDAAGTAVAYAKLSVAQDATQGECYSGGVWRNWLPKVTLTYEADRFVDVQSLSQHTSNIAAHLSTDERAVLSELLANKDALLALLNN